MKERFDKKTWLCDAEEGHFVCPRCHNYALRDWALAPVDSKYCPFCGEALDPWDGESYYTHNEVEI